MTLPNDACYQASASVSCLTAMATRAHARPCSFSPKGLVDLHRIETVVPLEPPAAQVEVEKALATALSRARPEGVVIATRTQDSDMVVGLLDLKQQQS